ncbi:TetR/AcrR family transcriptional regulator [Deinococcus humi]|uniref:AcrR family transcriptional regulator n=1 Tax=Deinococcus humi TaxID=662880 RepID=A0A7W8JTW7_9DEIO|nr:TetR/AcrR family transcriptional regulator [Deinococcus humi]MBB5363172.1 AcrR family transcriptional regulator [Deinococcus humi]GGO27838.1 TetR family transcriptional regulator [Deinococcus humi]
MKVDRQEQDEARRERIARAAFELFARSGLEATSVQDIAQAAFVSRTNLYRYFPSKIHMLLAHFNKDVQASRDDALERLHAGANPQQVWEKVMARMADLGVRYRHLVGAVAQAVLGASPLGEPEQGNTGARTKNPLSFPTRLSPADGLGTALTLGALVEPVLLAMQAQGRLRPEVNVAGLSALLVDACLLALMHGGHRDQREVLRDWQDRFSLLMSGALAPGVVVEGQRD